MITPTIEEARSYRKNFSVVPISLELLADIKTPIEVLKILKQNSKKCYLLESVEGGERWGRYSFLGFEPKMSLKCENKTITIDNVVVQGSDPSEVIRGVLKDYQSPQLSYLPTFTGGFVGYFAYDYVQYTEEAITLTTNDSVGFSDMELMLFDQIIVFDHLKQKMILIVNIKMDDVETNYRNGVSALKEIENMITGTTPTLAFTGKLTSEWEGLFTEEAYCQNVEKIKKHIYEGDIFQAVLANRYSAVYEGDLLSTYRVLKTINPSPYMFYIDFDGLQIAGASPETLISLKEKKISTFPIAGTCKRGLNDLEDEKLIQALLKDPKELAEHNMLVDLGRNDLGKIANFGSVEVFRYQEVLKFSHVSHIASTVTAQIRPDLDQLDAIAAILPAGTLSGAPKIKAMNIINELEGCKRGIYGGAIGYIDFSGNMDLCIAIRMATLKDKKVYVSAGAGIVADSVPHKEFMECLNKANAMFSALEKAQEVK